MDQSNSANYLDSEKHFYEQIAAYFQESSGSFSEKMHAVARWLPRQSLSYLLARNEVYQQIVPLHGSVLDFGIYRGGSFFTWLQLCSIYEPYNHIRKVIGFDSFAGFSEFSQYDNRVHDPELILKKSGGMAYPNGPAELARGVELYDLNRPLGNVKKGIIVEGLLPSSVKIYLQQHPETIVALANFGLGLYEPTLEILRSIRPRMPKGSILLFEDLNQQTWPGETQALLEVFSPDQISLQRVPYCPHLSWMKVL